MGNKIIWQPEAVYQPGYDFRISLDQEFAKRMFDSKLSKEKRERIQKLPEELIQKSSGKLKGIKLYEPYLFFGNTCLVKQVNLDAGDGKWLSLDDAFGGREPNFESPLKYSTHNLDYRASSHDFVDLMSLFDLWAEYCPLLCEDNIG